MSTVQPGTSTNLGADPGKAGMTVARRPILFLVALVFAAGVAVAASAADPWSRWQANDPSSTGKIDHGPWGEFLARHALEGADGVNRVDYAGVSKADRRRLDGYIQGLAALPISRFDRDEQLAYWANLYNALTVRVVLDHYPVSSIRDIRISPGLFSVGPWGRKLVTVESEALSLDDIEHRIMRPIWRDPRIHYMVNCAALGCPNIQPKPFTADNLAAILDAAARAFVNHPRGARVENGRLHVSSIFNWYKEDFGVDDTGVIAHLRRYANESLAAALGRIERIDDHEYDWRLNEPKALAKTQG